MTLSLNANEVADQLKGKFSDSIVETRPDGLIIKPESIVGIFTSLKITPGLEFDYLSSVTAVDYWDYFELVYHFFSLSRNHSLVVKARLEGREKLHIASATPLFKSADYQEREIYDLFGIVFDGHPNLKRIVLWEGFKGYPLRKEYL